MQLVCILFWFLIDCKYVTPVHTCPRTPQRYPRRSCRSVPASPRPWHWPGVTRPQSWQSSEGWCTGWTWAQSERRWACCESCCTGLHECMLLELLNNVTAHLSFTCTKHRNSTCFEEEWTIDFIFLCPEDACQILRHVSWFWFKYW